MLKRSLCLSLITVCLLATGVTSSPGQILAVPVAANAPATNAPAAVPPIPLSDILGQAQSITSKVRDEQARLADDQVIQFVEDNLPILTRNIDERDSEDTHLLDSTPSLASLQSSQAVWHSLSANLNDATTPLGNHAKLIEKQIAELNQQAAIWQATLDSTAKMAPPAINQQVKDVLTAITDTLATARKVQSQILAVQGQVAIQNGRINDDLDRISKAMDVARKRLFEQDHPPLWNADAVFSTGPGMVAQESVSLHTQLAGLRIYLQDRTSTVVIHGLILIFFVFGLHWIRAAIKSQAEKETALHHAAQIFDAPLATALLLTLLASVFLYPQAPRLLWAIIISVGLIPAVMIIRRLIEPALFSVLYATVISAFFDQLRHVAMPTGVLSRFLFILELLAVSIFLLAVLRTRRPTASEQPTRTQKVFQVYLHCAFFIFIFAGLVNAIGYGGLSVLAGEGMLESSYLAVIMYASVRILAALTIAALNIRPFTRLRMVRLHREMLYQNISTIICWLAYALWAVAALQLFSLRDPLWQSVEHILTFNHSYFSIDFSLEKIIALPLTIWATFLLSRFIRFCLEEEIYPHLPLGRGIPYATSTMVHYVVLIFGCFIALSAAGIDLSKYTILAGAFGVGLGFGLQNIMNNFISGIILLFERPVKVGDTIQLDPNTMGKVERIGIRASVILLTNGAELIVPNGNLISSPVTNWTLSNSERLVEIPVTVTSKTDPQQVADILIRVAQANHNVIKNPAPEALLITITGATLTFRLRAWIDAEDQWMKVTSDLSLAINSALAKENIALG